MADWKLIKTQFEILGTDVSELATKHNVSVDLLENAIKTQHWSRNNMPVDEDVAEALSKQSEVMMSHHQAAIMPRYITLETAFFNKVETLIANIMNAEEVKKMAEALAILKPSIMKAADVVASGSTGDNRILIVNKYDVPQPGDKDYIAPNSVLMGKHAQRTNGLLDVENMNYETIEVPNYDDKDDLN